MSTSNGKPTPTENQQLVDFLRIHLKTDTAIADALGYSSSTIKNIYDREDNKPATTMMLQHLAQEVMLEAARAGSLVRPELPLTVSHTKKDIEQVVRRVMQNMSQAA